MKAWPMASVALPYVSPNANCPQFKQLFHLDICKCVYKYWFINVAQQFLRRRSESFSNARLLLWDAAGAAGRTLTNRLGPGSA